MWNPLRWIFRRSPPHTAPNPVPATEESPGSSPTAETGELEALRNELLEKVDDRLREQEAAEARRHESLLAALSDLRRAVEHTDATLRERLTALETQQSQIREELGTRLDAAEERQGRMERRGEETLGRTDLLETQLRKLAETFERQLSETETVLDNLRRASEAQLEEVRRSHRRQLGAIEAEKQSLQEQAAQAREHFGRLIEEAASYLERDASLPVPVRHAGERTPEAPLPGWVRPARRLRAWWRRRSCRRQRILELEQRARDLQGWLTARQEESVQRGRELRRRWHDEVERLPASQPSEASEPSLDVDTLAQRLRARRNGIGNGAGRTAGVGASD